MLCRYESDAFTKEINTSVSVKIRWLCKSRLRFLEINNSISFPQVRKYRKIHLAEYKGLRSVFMPQYSRIDLKQEHIENCYSVSSSLSRRVR